MAAKGVVPPRNSAVFTAIRLLDQIVQLHHDFRPFEAAGVTHDFLVRIALHVSLDVLLGLPFRIRDELAGRLRPQQLLRKTTLLLDHERSAFCLPDLLGLLVLGWIELDVNEPNDRHGVTSPVVNCCRAGWPEGLTFVRLLEPHGSVPATLRRSYNPVARTSVPWLGRSPAMHGRAALKILAGNWRSE